MKNRKKPKSITATARQIAALRQITVAQNKALRACSDALTEAREAIATAERIKDAVVASMVSGDWE